MSVLLIMEDVNISVLTLMALMSANAEVGSDSPVMDILVLVCILV